MGGVRNKRRHQYTTQESWSQFGVLTQIICTFHSMYPHFHPVPDCRTLIYLCNSWALLCRDECPCWSPAEVAEDCCRGFVAALLLCWRLVLLTSSSVKKEVQPQILALQTQLGWCRHLCWWWSKLAGFGQCLPFHSTSSSIRQQCLKSVLE